MEERKAFTFYKSFFDAIEQIPDAEQRAKAYKTICNYALNNVTPEDNIDFISNIILTQAKPQIDANNERYVASVENGKRGGAPKGNTNASKSKKDTNSEDKKQPKTTQNNLKQPKTTTNNNVNVKVNNNINERDTLSLVLSLSQNIENNLSEDTDITECDMDKVCQAVKESEFLKNSSLDFIFSNYNDVINGKYKTFKVFERDKGTPTHNFKGRDYSNTDLNSLYTNLDELEL